MYPKRIACCEYDKILPNEELKTRIADNIVAAAREDLQCCVEWPFPRLDHFQRCDCVIGDAVSVADHPFVSDPPKDTAEDLANST